MAKTKLDPWHFARPSLAKKFIDSFEIGLVSAHALFAPRRMGKSEFLEQDLIPAAKKAGYLTAYLNLWDAREQPRLALINALTSAKNSRAGPAILKVPKSPLKKAKASVKVGPAEGSIEAELLDDRRTGPALTDLLRGFKGPRKLLLVLDEAQILASANRSDLTHSLRAALDTRKQSIKVVFAGSSENSLRQMFGRATEPFYNWAPIEPFERLGAEFVSAMTAKVNQLSRFPLSENDALNAYAGLKRTPEFFRRFLQRYLAYAQLGWKAALEDTRSHVFNDAGYRSMWSGLLPADQAVLRALANGQEDIHSASMLAQLGNELGLGKPAPLDTPRHALRRLQKHELVIRLSHGLYRIQDDGLFEWLRQMDLEE